MNERRASRGIAVAALAVVALTTAVAAGAGMAGTPAAGAIVEHRGAMVTFRTPTSDDFVLVVSGDGYRSRQRFAGGQTAFFLPVDRRGFALPDGLYKWELVTTPELSTETAAKQGPPAHGRAVHRAPKAEGRRQSGAFSIENGRMVDPSLVEVPSRPPAGTRTDSSNAGAAARYDDSDAAASDGR